MPDKTALKTKIKQETTSFHSEKAVTFTNLSERIKNDIFSYVAKDDNTLQEVINKYHLDMTPEEVRFQHFIETSIEEKGEPEESHEEKHDDEHHKDHGGHGGHGGHHEEFKPDMLHAVENHDDFKKVHEELKKEKTKTWDENKALEDFRKKYGKNPDLSSDEWKKHLDNDIENPESHALKKKAEEKFRKDYSDEAKKLDQQAREDTSAENSSKDKIRIQYMEEAARRAKERVEKKHGKDLKNGKISDEEFRAKANEAFEEENKNMNRQFVKDNWKKATHAAIKENDKELQEAFKEIGSTRAGKYYKKEAKKHTSENFQKPIVRKIDEGKTVPSNKISKQKNQWQSPIDFFNKFLPKRTDTAQPKNETAHSSRDKTMPSASYPPMPEPPKSNDHFTPQEIEHGQRQILKDLGNIQYPSPAEMEQIAAEEFTPQEREIEYGQRQMLNEYASSSPPSPPDVPHFPDAGKVTDVINAVKNAEKVGEAVEAVEGAAPLILNPYFWLVLGILLLIIIIIVLVFNLVQQQEQQRNANQNANDTAVLGLSITLKALAPAVANGDNQQVSYEADVTCDQVCQGSGPINIYIDTLPTGTTPVPATGNNTQYTTTPYAMTWNLPANVPTYTITFALNTSAQINDTKVGLTVKGALAGNTGNANAGPIGDVPATTNNCGGKYTYYMSITPGGKNYGDPNCDFTNDLLATVINSVETSNDKDPGIAERQKCFFFIIAKWESQYNANAYLAASTSTLGAYGLFQMNPASAGHQSVFDVGDVYWKLQTENAVKNNVLHGNHFAYWDPRTIAHDTNNWCHP